VPKRKTSKKTVGHRPWGYLFPCVFIDFAREYGRFRDWLFRQRNKSGTFFPPAALQ